MSLVELAAAGVFSATGRSSVAAPSSVRGGFSTARQGGGASWASRREQCKTKARVRPPTYRLFFTMPLPPYNGPRPSRLASGTSHRPRPHERTTLPPHLFRPTGTAKRSDFSRMAGVPRLQGLPVFPGIAGPRSRPKRRILRSSPVSPPCAAPRRLDFTLAETSW